MITAGISYVHQFISKLLSPIYDGHSQVILHGQLHKMDVVYTKIVPNMEIEFKITSRFWRIFYPKSTLTTEQSNDYCIFTAKTYDE